MVVHRSSCEKSENICMRLSRLGSARRSHFLMIGGRTSPKPAKGSWFPADERWVPRPFTLTPAYTIITQIHSRRDLSFHFTSFHPNAAERTHHEHLGERPPSNRHEWPAPGNETGVALETDSTPNDSIRWIPFFSPDVSKYLILSHTQASDSSPVPGAVATGSRSLSAVPGAVATGSRLILEHGCKRVNRYCALRLIYTGFTNHIFLGTLLFPARKANPNSIFREKSKWEAKDRFPGPSSTLKIGKSTGWRKQSRTSGIGRPPSQTQHTPARLALELERLGT